MEQRCESGSCAGMVDGGQRSCTSTGLVGSRGGVVRCSEQNVALVHTGSKEGGEELEVLSGL